MAPDIKLLIAVPTMGSIHPMLVNRLLKWVRQHKQVSFYFTYRVSPVDRARNQIVEFFLSKNFTHLLMIDSDTIPPEDAIEKLLSHDKDITSGMTPILRYNEEDRDWEVYDNCFIAAEKDEGGKIIKTFIAQRNTGLKEIFRCGTACLLIKREVFEKLQKPYFRFITNDAGTEHIRSEDINFCDEARAAGISIFADTSVYAQHYKDIML